ncbi:MAG TPA: DNA polymerase III subunit delta [Dehalococcoidales bacterium]|nr:DNA polymerase III subunit delta [Dehalococcoidales bacterium]
MLYILSGQDDFSIYQSLEEIKRKMGDQTMLVTNTTILDGQQLTLDQLKTVCDASPFLAEKRLVIIKGLLERFESKGKPSRRKKAASTDNSQNEAKLLAEYTGNIPDTTILVLIDGKISSNNPLLKGLAGAQMRSFPLLREPQLHQWIQSRVAREGSSISPQAVDLLAKMVGSNLWIMSNEIDKLILFTAGRRIEIEDIRKIVSYAQQTNVFAMIDAILESKAGLAQQLLQQLLQGGASSAYLLAILAHQLQMIVRVKELRNQRKSQQEIQDRLGITSEFALRKTLEQTGMYSWERLKEVYHRLLEADLSIKTGKYDDELALNILIAELCQR